MNILSNRSGRFHTRAWSLCFLCPHRPPLASPTLSVQCLLNPAHPLCCLSLLSLLLVPCTPSCIATVLGWLKVKRLLTEYRKLSQTKVENTVECLEKLRMETFRGYLTFISFFLLLSYLPQFTHLLHAPHYVTFQLGSPYFT